MISTGGAPPRGKDDPLSELDIDELVERLTPGEIQKLLDECDPDDPHIPPSLRTNYKCEKQATGPLNRKKLMDYINDQALNTPDIPDAVPHVPGTVRGKKWIPPPKPQDPKESLRGLLDEEIELDIDLGDDTESALNDASTAEIVDLAGILGLHSMMNQDQYHSAQSDKWAKPADPSVGWNGITKATPLKEFPPEEPNRTDPEEVITKLSQNDESADKVNLNNVPVSEKQFMRLFEALSSNETLEDLSMANTMLGDFAAGNLAKSIESNKALEKINIESNNVSPQTLIKLFEAANVQQVLTDVKASNQQAQFLGNKVEMAITKAVENNKSLLRVGLHFEFNDCRNRVAVQLQKNLDRVRLRRIAHKLSTAAAAKAVTNTSRTGGMLGGLPGQLSAIPRQKEMTPASDAGSSEYEYYYEDEEEDSGSAPR
jgi:tropomodulin